jgi:hypothetical protein
MDGPKVESGLSRSGARSWTRRQVLGAGVAILAAAAGARIVLPWPTRGRSRWGPGRTLQCLNGSWEFAPAYRVPLGYPPAVGWTTVRVPSEWNMTVAPFFATPWDGYNIWETPASWDRAVGGWYRRRVTVPALPPDYRIYIRFEAVNYSAVVYWDGMRVGQHEGGTTPFEVDVTAFVRPGGDHELLVAVTGPVGIRGPTGFLAPVGSWWGQSCGGIWQDVWLERRAPVWVADVVPRASVRRGCLTGWASLVNTTDRAQTVSVTHIIWDNARAVLTSRSRATVPANGRIDVPVEWSWRDAHLWHPDDPYLYQWEVDVRPSVRGPVWDSFSVRFGFREVWVANGKLWLNGSPLRLRGDQWHYFGSLENQRAYAETWFTMAKAAHCNYIRLHAMPYPPVFADVADEQGMLLVAESAIYGSSKNLALSHQSFWEAAHEHLRARVRRDRHHPSIILWSAENEVLAANGQAWAPQVAELRQAILAEDTTRPIYFEGDGDPEGVADLVSWHYPLEIADIPAIPEDVSRWRPPLPNKPVMISEFGAMFYGNPQLLAGVGGDLTYLGLDGFWRANALVTTAQIRGFRALGVTGVAPWNTVWYGLKPLPFPRRTLHWPHLTGPGAKPKEIAPDIMTLNPGWIDKLPDFEANPIHQAVQAAFFPQGAYVRDEADTFFGGTLWAPTADVYNDTSSTVQLLLSWGPSGAMAQTRALVLRPGGHAVVELQTRWPQVARPSAVTWELLVRIGPRVVQRTVRQIRLFPAPEVFAERGTPVVAMVDPEGTLTSLNERQGFVRLTPGPTPRISRAILPEGTLQRLPAASLEAWGRWVVAGGRLAILAQTPGIRNPWGVTLETRPQTITHPRAPLHRVVRGYSWRELSWWAGNDGIVATAVFPKVDDPRWLCLADADSGLKTAVLARGRFGSGKVLWCQYDLQTHRNKAPQAEDMSKRIVNWVRGPGAPLRQLGVWGVQRDYEALVEVGISVRDVETLQDIHRNPVDVLLVNKGVDPSARPSVIRWVAAGGWLWIHDWNGRGIPGLLPRSLRLVDIPENLRYGATPEASFETAGMSAVDWDWTEVGQPVAMTALRPRAGSVLMRTVPVDWRLYGGSPEQVKTALTLRSGIGFESAALWWAMDFGHGRVIVDQTLWQQSHRLAYRVRARLAAAWDLVLSTP